MIPPAITATLAAATTVVKAAPGELVAILLVYGSAEASIIIYDNPSAGSGTAIAKLIATSTTKIATWTPSARQRAHTGLTAVVAGTGATAYVVFY